MGLTKYPDLFSPEIMHYTSFSILQWLDTTFPNNRSAKIAHIAAIRHEFRFVKWLYYNGFPFDFPELYRSLYLKEDTSIFQWLYTIHPLPKEILLSYEPSQDHSFSFWNQKKIYRIKSWIEQLPF